MAERRRLSERHVKIHGALPSLVRRNLSWKLVAFVVALMAVPSLAVHFFDRIAYENSLGQQQASYNALQDEENNQQQDLQHLIKNTKTQLNCLQLQSNAGKKLCEQHDATTQL